MYNLFASSGLKTQKEHCRVLKHNSQKTRSGITIAHVGISPCFRSVQRTTYTVVEFRISFERYAADTAANVHLGVSVHCCAGHGGVWLKLVDFSQRAGALGNSDQSRSESSIHDGKSGRTGEGRLGGNIIYSIGCLKVIFALPALVTPDAHFVDSLVFLISRIYQTG